MIFPDNTVWLVRVIPAGSMPVEGSAVAIRLQRVVSQPDVSKQGDPNTARTYLLTCAHVLRGKASWHREGEVEGTGYGAIAPEATIRVWPPGVGVTDDQAKAVRVCRDLRRINESEIPLEQRDSHVEDWVVLELVDDNAAKGDGLYSDDWFEPTNGLSSLLGVGDCYWPIGYPGGSDSLKNGITHPTTSRLLSLGGESGGLLRLTGDEARPGMSGGGVFSRRTFLGVVPLPWSRPRLAGIHRARDYDKMQLQALSAKMIRSFIESVDVPFELCRQKPRPPKWPMILFLAAIVLPLLFFPWAPRRRPTTVNVIAYAGELRDGKIFKSPLTGARIGVHPEGFSLKWTEEASTDNSGRGTIRFEADTTKTPVAGYFVVGKADGIDLPVTTEFAAIARGGITQPLMEPRFLLHGDEVRLVIVSEKILPEYLATVIRERLGSNPSYSSSDLVSKRFGDVGSEIGRLNLTDMDTKRQVVGSVTRSVLPELPELTANGSVASKWPVVREAGKALGIDDQIAQNDLEGLAALILLQRRPSIPVGSNDAPDQWQQAVAEGNRLAESVCYVRTREPDTTWNRSGFVVGEDLVMTVLFDENESFESVGFGANPEADTDRSRLAILESILFADQQVALLRVPKLNRPALKLASENPFLPDRRNSVSIVGYIAPDSRVPETFRKAISRTPETAKRIMPGIFLQETDPSKPKLLHDATTSGGAAGSPMIDTSTGLVVGVHIAGSWNEGIKNNQALPIWWLLGNAEISRHLQVAAVAPLGIDELRLNSDLKALLAPLVAGLNFSVMDHETRHKEEETIKIGPLEQKIAVYWWSVLSGNVQARNAGEGLKLSTSVSERSPTEIAVSLRLTVPLKGSVDSRAETDSPRAKIASLNTDYTTVANATVDARVVLSPDRGSVLAVEMPVWRTKLSETRFSQPLADRLAPVIESHVNDLIAKEMEKLLSKAKDDIGRQLKATRHE